MSLFQKELTELEVDPVEVVEFSRPERNSGQETLKSSKGEVDSTDAMVLEGNFPLLQMELLELEVEPLKVIEISPLEQNTDLETLVSSKGEVDTVGVMILKGILPTNDNCCCSWAYFQCCNCCPNGGLCCQVTADDQPCACCCCPDPRDPQGRPWPCDGLPAH